jgi:hypothetical protein
MIEQPLDDDAELLRSLKPTRPEIDWQKVLAKLPEPAGQKNALADPLGSLTATRDATYVIQPDLIRGQPWFGRLISSWWSGALAGSLITFALLRFLATQPVDSEQPEFEVAQTGLLTTRVIPTAKKNPIQHTFREI